MDQVITKRGIPTVRKGRIYRSRLEAKWASFFELLDWKFEYEPLDLNGWIPDFMIFGHKPILVEVKPFYVFSADSPLFKTMTKANNTGYEMLVLGVSILQNTDGIAQLGWLFEDRKVDSAPAWVLDNALLAAFRKGIKFQQFGFMAEYGSYQDRISGLYDGNGHIETIFLHEELLPMWNEACNKVQWKSPEEHLI